jgi:hypothetical protein
VALQGTLETFALPDVLRLLASTKKSGVLRVDTERGHGELVVSGGSLVGGNAERAPLATEPAELLFEMLRSTDGSFVFDADADVVADGAGIDVDTALSSAEEQLAEWTAIEAVVPSPYRRVTLVASRDAEITLTADQWAVIAAIGGGRTVDELGGATGATELVTSRYVRDLVELGAVELSAEDVDAAPRPTPTVVAEPEAAIPTFEAPAPQPEPEPEPQIDPEPAPLPVRQVNGSRVEAMAPEAIAPVSPLFGDAPAPPPEPAPAWQPSNFGDDSSSFFDDEEDPLADDPFGPDPFRLPKLSGLDEATDGEAAEMARQLANLSPRAAQAVAAAAAATTDEEREQALAEVDEDGEDPVNRGLLLKFLSSVDE